MNVTVRKLQTSGQTGGRRNGENTLEILKIGRENGCARRVKRITRPPPARHLSPRRDSSPRTSTGCPPRSAAADEGRSRKVHVCANTQFHTHREKHRGTFVSRTSGAAREPHTESRPVSRVSRTPSAGRGIVIVFVVVVVLVNYYYNNKL